MQMSTGMGNDGMPVRGPAIGRQRNPFEAPAARVEDVRAAEAGELIENGRRVPVGNGLTWIGSGW
jgi:hypothetical protein